jgi:dTDP-glucose pyrophosphorylase
MKPALLVMAAGIGSRYGGIKQLEGFGPSGERIIDYTLYDAMRAGFGKIVFVIRRDIERDFREAVADPWRGRVPMEFAFQELNALPDSIGVFTAPPQRKKPWGTGHAIWTGRNHIQGPFAVANADDFYGSSAFEAVGRYLSGLSGVPKPDYALVGYRLDRTLSEYGSVSRGICSVNADGYLTGLKETMDIIREGEAIVQRDPDGRLHPLAPETLVSMNHWGFGPSYFSHLETRFRSFLRDKGTDPKAEFYLTTVIDDLIRSGTEKVKVLSTDARWFGVTYREDRPAVERNILEFIRQGVYPKDIRA